MNIVYAIQESPNKWGILAAISVTVGLTGTIAIIIYNWSHWFARIWFLAGLLIAIYCVARLVLEWKKAVDESLTSSANTT